MADGTSIEWTDATWNPVRGCSLVSPGCTNCYAMRQAHRHANTGGAYEGLTKMSKGGPVWTGKVTLHPELLDWPLRKKKPLRIFVNSMSDLFHEDVPDEFITSVWRTMAEAPQHVFQILTKRPQRMLDYILPGLSIGGIIARPLENVWLGVSVEDQARADERIPLLHQTPAAVRWISAEPLLGPIDMHELAALSPGREGGAWRFLDWVVAGGESGPGARPMHPDWARSLRDQCAAVGTPFFFKQWGAWAPEWAWTQAATVEPASGKTTNPNANMGPRGLAVQGPNTLFRVGKKAAGRLLDGRTHDEYPA